MKKTGFQDIRPVKSTNPATESSKILSNMNLVMRKPAFCLCENKDADQLRGNREADQRLCFRNTDSTIPLLHKSEISSLSPSSVAVQPGLFCVFVLILV